MDNPLWEYALRTYAREHVASACLDLQDRFGMDVNLLLYAAWLAREGRRLTHEHLAALDAVVTGWRGSVIRPLRGLRRALDCYLPPPGVSIELNLAGELKTLELRAERQQHDMMYVYSCDARELARAEYPLLANLALVAQFSSPADTGWVPVIDYLYTLLPRG